MNFLPQNAHGSSSSVLSLRNYPHSSFLSSFLFLTESLTASSFSHFTQVLLLYSFSV